MKKLLFLILVFFFIPINSQAIDTNINFFTGPAHLANKFDDSWTLGVGVDFMLTDSMALSLKANYIETNRTISPGLLRLVPIEADLKYIFNPYGQVCPYLAGGINVNILSSTYSTPTIGVNLRGGAAYKIDRYNIFVEAEKILMHDNKNDTDITPFIINFGVGILGAFNLLN
ncbi:MAG: hypothetical protein DKM50_01950 [Candidatus Margulisiibacteriota bacterium]|nr:MAG: hypothetical protein A2X43_13195 [Candidatus Margulisbacteria bacterium GWD2_39_127]OGI04787.1 MAG: hypothetical protein A2X42_10800 [Candidatus Margulisbacteria bacterium GWF2_38_17]OGI05732.1 MAG: hypothetical protein A2X41_03385 [Candidatus Margulisbacteria bacterium GWE2_39_32]PZM83667.1 MAG: hypothetical protein DKM50_01950 [Candidatus Margulisiibacteriota bacterium]HAR62085.1 hypothetical protein [Candidatus Margulisiibacteriota bacterium]